MEMNIKVKGYDGNRKAFHPKDWNERIEKTIS